MLNSNLRYLLLKNPDGSIREHKKCIFLKHFITKKDIIEVGDYTYYDMSGGGEGDASLFENENVLYAFPGSKLEIGRFCQIAQNVKFMLQCSNHHTKPFTTYPLFWNFLDKYDNYFDAIPDQKYFKHYGKTVIGNDVWLGYDTLIMPGIRIGSGAIVGARSVVTKDVEPYTIVAGNPAKVIRKRFAVETIEKLLAVSWWNWKMEDIVANYDHIMDCNIEKLMVVMKSY